MSAYLVQKGTQNIEMNDLERHLQKISGHKLCWNYKKALFELKMNSKNKSDSSRHSSFLIDFTKYVSFQVNSW